MTFEETKILCKELLNTMDYLETQKYDGRFSATNKLWWDRNTRCLTITDNNIYKIFKVELENYLKNNNPNFTNSSINVFNDLEAVKIIKLYSNIERAIMNNKLNIPKKFKFFTHLKNFIYVILFIVLIITAYNYFWK